MEEKKGTRGGRREGSGRPRGINTTPMYLKLRNELVEYVRSKKNMSRFVNDCIKKEMEREMGE